jgi:TRAP-type C4-dicarboxylate transport system permease small subunit
MVLRMKTKNLKKVPLGFESAVFSINKVMAIIAAIVLCGMMLLTVGDVIGRYFFNSPIKGTWELIGYFLICAGTWGLGYCQMQKGHISVTIILDRFTGRVKAIILSFTYLIGLAGFSLICWRMFLLSYKYFLMPRGNVSDTLELPLAPFMLALSIGAGLISLVLLIDLVRSVTDVIRK